MNETSDDYVKRLREGWELSRVLPTSSIFIYLFDGHGPRHSQMVRLRETDAEACDQLAISTLTLGEILVKPLEQRNGELVKKYEAAIVATRF